MQSNNFEFFIHLVVETGLGSFLKERNKILHKKVYFKENCKIMKTHPTLKILHNTACNKVTNFPFALKFDAVHAIIQKIVSKRKPLLAI